MFLFYYDEVKLHPPNQKSFWLGGIGVREELVLDLEEQIGVLADDVFKSRKLERGTEFHGKEIFFGKGAFKGRKFEDRLLILERLLGICAAPGLVRFFIRINPENYVVRQETESVAFMMLVEQIDEFLKKQGSLGMIFGDFDDPAIGPSVAALSAYRKDGTQWRNGRKIGNIIDTVHFAKSHHSRLIQLADVFLYAKQFYSYYDENTWRQRFNEVIAASGVLKCTFAKNWPSSKSWQRGT
ncbi:DUF3800 domain-containing protein [Rubellimicrobium roseum]|uniref:DUF3800 domain-containing protein n=1 Tax=Rubellimicrobium roseum TaxID=687525 RepID=UPI00159B8B88|nr:DUF3800 domain-containing protein [Rubellimicrobium roseum]